VDNTEASDPFQDDEGTAVVVDGGTPIGVQVNDFKPGDSFVLKTSVKVDGNPAYVRAVANDISDGDDSGTSFTEPENDTDDSPGMEVGGDDGINGTGELDNKADVRVANSTDFQNDTDASLRGSLNQHLKDLSTDSGGIDFRDGNGNLRAIGPNNSPVSVYTEFSLPTTVGNVIQGDSVSYDLTFQAVQVRNNASTDEAFNSTFGN